MILKTREDILRQDSAASYWDNQSRTVSLDPVLGWHLSAEHRILHNRGMSPGSSQGRPTQNCIGSALGTYQLILWSVCRTLEINVCILHREPQIRWRQQNDKSKPIWPTNRIWNVKTAVRWRTDQKVSQVVHFLDDVRCIIRLMTYNTLGWWHLLSGMLPWHYYKLCKHRKVNIVKLPPEKVGIDSTCWLYLYGHTLQMENCCTRLWTVELI